jgi:hypothetical protein
MLRKAWYGIIGKTKEANMSAHFSLREQILSAPDPTPDTLITHVNTRNSELAAQNCRTARRITQVEVE